MDVYNTKDEYVGKIDQDGEIFDFNGDYRGRVELISAERRSVVFNCYETFVGSIQRTASSEMTMYAPTGQFVATIDDDDGEIYRNFAKQRNAQELRSVGSVETEGNDPYIFAAAAIFFANSALFWTNGIPNIARVNN